jgi:hypothetical protein
MKKPSGNIQSMILSIIFSLICTPALTQNTLQSSSAAATSDSAGWYTSEQATKGAKTYQKTCARCHGAKLQGGMGPGLVGICLSGCFSRPQALDASTKRWPNIWCFAESTRQAEVGKQFWLAYGGKKVSTLWSTVHTQMPMMAPGSVSANNSIDILAFLLQKNGVPSGTVRLDDTADLSKVLPSK